MRDVDNEARCPLCKLGRVAVRPEEIAFHQSTSKGYVFCRVTVPVGVCEHCGSRILDQSAEAVMEQAVRDACDKLR